jgi:hypothetical protein
MDNSSLPPFSPNGQQFSAEWGPIKPSPVAAPNSVNAIVAELTKNEQYALKQSLIELDAGDPELLRPIPLSKEIPYLCEEFPVRALGEGLHWTVKAIAELVQCPLGLAAMSVLGAVSLATQAHANVVLPHGEVKPISLFLATIAATGERKTASDSWATKAVKKREQMLGTDYTAKFAHYRNAHEVWESQRSRILRSNTEVSNVDKLTALFNVGPEPQAPPTPMLTCQEPTFEGLCLLYEQGYPSLGIFTDEGGQFLGGHGLNDEARIRTVTNLSKSWDGDDIKRVRASKISTLPGKRLSLHLMIQPKLAQQFFSNIDFQDQGILSRILLANPPSLIGTRMQRDINPAVMQYLETYDAALLRLLEMPLPTSASNSKQLTPRSLAMDVEAVKLWKQFADENETDMHQGNRYESIHGLANKLAEHAARIAGCLAIFYDCNVAHISADFMEQGIRIAKYFGEQAVLYLDSSMKDIEIGDAELLYNWLTGASWREDYIGVKAVCQLGPKSLRKARTAKSAIAILEENNWLRPAPSGTYVNGIAVKQAWKIVREE